MATPDPTRPEEAPAALEKLRGALRENDVYPEGHDLHYRHVIRPIEEIGIACQRCGAQIDAVDVRDLMVSEGPQAGPEQALAARWTCENCSKGER